MSNSKNVSATAESASSVSSDASSFSVSAKTISKTFKLRSGGTITPVDQVSLDVPIGQAVALMGHNGAGKTTLLKVFATLIVPDTGELTVGGISFKNSTAIRQNIGLMSTDERSFYWRLTGWQNLHFFAALQNMSKRTATQRINALAEEFGIDYLDRRFMNFSAGMKQSLSMLRALLHDPDLLLLDEPTRSLDPEATEHFSNRMRQLVTTKNKTLILATHNPSLAQSLCDRIVVMENGKKIDDKLRFTAVGEARSHIIETTALSTSEMKQILGFLEVEEVTSDPINQIGRIKTKPLAGALHLVLQRISRKELQILSVRAVEGGE